MRRLRRAAGELVANAPVDVAVRAVRTGVVCRRANHDVLCVEAAPLSQTMSDAAFRMPMPSSTALALVGRATAGRPLSSRIPCESRYRR